MKQRLRIARVMHGTSAEGPGVRSAVWFQGCSIRCPGCINPHLFSPKGGEDADLNIVLERAIDSGAEGITLLGGEPFDQPGAGAQLAEMAQGRGLGVIAFTGFTYEKLIDKDASTHRLLAAIDLLVDGPYIAEARDGLRSLVGSTNQRFIHLSKRYAAYRPELNRNRIDVRVGADGLIELAGFLGTEDLTSFAEIAGVRRQLRSPSLPTLDKAPGSSRIVS